MFFMTCKQIDILSNQQNNSENSQCKNIVIPNVNGVSSKQKMFFFSKTTSWYISNPTGHSDRDWSMLKDKTSESNLSSVVYAVQ